MKSVILPLSGNDVFRPLVEQVKSVLRAKNVSFQVDDSSSSIGRRYSRNDELGIAFAITIDFDTVKDGTVTLRDRDSTTQVRLPITKVGDVLLALCQEGLEQLSWETIKSTYPVFIEQKS